MPYVYYDELPEGAEPADVVTRAEYDSLIEERDSTIRQRDDALGEIENARKEVRDVKAKYADYILSASNKPTEEPKQVVEELKPVLPMSASELF